MMRVIFVLTRMESEMTVSVWREKKSQVDRVASKPVNLKIFVVKKISSENSQIVKKKKKARKSLGIHY